MLKKNLFFIGGLLLIGGFGIYWVLTSGSEDVRDGGSGVAEQPSKYAVTRAEILQTVAMLQAVKLDITILDEPAFRSLSEVPRLWEQESFKVGERRNPFTPTP